MTQAAYYNRSNSVTSFGSFTSMAETQRIPRDTTTAGLLDVDPKFQRASRSKMFKTFPSSSSLAPQDLPTPRSYVPRSHSFQQNPMELHSPLRKSESLTSIPTPRRQSVERAHIQQHKQLQKSSSSSQFMPQHAPLRRHGHRPKQQFTFPNGEVYTPRNKQPNSYQNLKRLNTQQHIDPRAPMSAPASGSIPRSAPHSASGSSSTIVSESGKNENDFLTLSFNNSDSPSPSGASRTNSSVNESTPASSIDDFTSTKSLQVESQIGPPVLHKIEELAGNPTGDTLNKIEIEDSTSTVEIIQSKKPSLREPTLIKSMQAFSKPVEPKKVEQRVPSPPQIQLSPQKVVKQSAIPAEIERKPSGIRKFFSRMFSSKKSKKANRLSVSDSKKSTTILLESGMAHSVHTHVQKTVVKPIERSIQEPTFRINDEPVSNSDAFSFIEGDEDDGINVGDFSDWKLDQGDDYRSEMILDALFSKLSGNEPKQKPKQERVSYEAMKNSVNPLDMHNSSDDDDFVMTFDDIEFIEKITEFGETSFPDLDLPDLGQSHRKMMRSKSIERRRSIRSLSTSTKWSQQSQTRTDDMDQFKIIKTNEPKDPNTSTQEIVSILKHKPSKHDNGKKVGFANEIFVNTTYPPRLYNRHSSAVSSYQLSPQVIQQIRRELNDFKRHMVVHHDSVGNTHFFRP